jgi:predicted nucleotidyltransferase
MDMSREQVIAALREHGPELKAAGVIHLALHGSYARGIEINTQSDVDVIADFDRARKLSLIGHVHIENRLTDILGVKADLADRANTGIADAIAMIEEFTSGWISKRSGRTQWLLRRSSESW